MAKKRRGNQTIRWDVVIFTAVVFTYLTATGVLYVWHDNRNDALHRDIASKNRLLEALLERRKSLDDALARRLSPRRLREQVERLGLGLVEPSPTQFLYLTEPPESWREPITPNAVLAAHAESAE
jgi:hypothetical protein